MTDRPHEVVKPCPHAGFRVDTINKPVDLLLDDILRLTPETGKSGDAKGSQQSHRDGAIGSEKLVLTVQMFLHLRLDLFDDRQPLGSG